MKKLFLGLRWVIGAVLLIGSISLGLGGIAYSATNTVINGGASSVKLEGAALTYSEECSACHLAYPPQLLPSRSWNAILDGLDDHFGENAELMPVTLDEVSAYLQSHAADVGNSRLGKKALRGLKDSDTPLRITKLPFYIRQHDEVPDKYVTGNPQVGSFSQCQACHGKASEQGIFNEDTVKIPGVKRWDD